MKKIAQGVAEFVSVQATQHRLSTGAAGFLVGGLEFLAQEFHNRFDGVCLGLWCLAGRHFAQVELIKNPLPDFQVFNLCKIVSEGIESNIPFLFFAAVAVITMTLKKGFHLLKWAAEEPPRSAE